MRLFTFLLPASLGCVALCMGACSASSGGNGSSDASDGGVSGTDGGSPNPSATASDGGPSANTSDAGSPIPPPMSAGTCGEEVFAPDVRVGGLIKESASAIYVAGSLLPAAGGALKQGLIRAPKSGAAASALVPNVAILSFAVTASDDFALVEQVAPLMNGVYHLGVAHGASAPTPLDLTWDGSSVANVDGIAQDSVLMSYGSTFYRFPSGGAPAQITLQGLPTPIGGVWAYADHVAVISQLALYSFPAAIASGGQAMQQATAPNGLGVFSQSGGSFFAYEINGSQYTPISLTGDGPPVTLGPALTLGSNATAVSVDATPFALNATNVVYGVPTHPQGSFASWADTRLVARNLMTGAEHDIGCHRNLGGMYPGTTVLMDDAYAYWTESLPSNGGTVLRRSKL